MQSKISLNAEQFTWIMTLSKGEKERITRLLRTGDWVLVWQESEHAYVLQRNGDVLQEET